MSELRFIEVIESNTGRSISIFINNISYFKPIVESREVKDKSKISLLCFENVVIGTEIGLKTKQKHIKSDTEYGIFKEKLLCLIWKE